MMKALLLKYASISGTLAAFITTVSVAATYPNPLPLETIPNSATLPVKYPTSWLFLHDFMFNSIVDGRVNVVDVAVDIRNLKGQIPAGQFAGFLQASARPNLYVAETYYSRRTRGERTDVITIFDTKTLAATGEIVLPGGKRGQFVTQPNAFQFTDSERLGLVFNFTPAASVTVVDLIDRKVLNDIDVPGCSLIYPMQTRGFFSLCSNGSVNSVQLDVSGKVIKQAESKAFNDVDNDPVFMMSAAIDGVVYFPTFHGRIQSVDVKGDVAKPLPAWSMLSKDDIIQNWRPAGWQLISKDDDKHLYVIMQPSAKDGSHKDGGTEVWVYDVAKKQRIQQIKLTNPAFTIEVTAGPKPYLVVASAAGPIDVYDAHSGKFLRSLGGQIAVNPLVIHATH